MEYLNLYDINECVIGKIERHDEIPKNCYEKIVVAIIKNNQNQLLIQKRTALKGGLWALTGGHIDYGETSLEGLKREVKEELGIDVSHCPITKFKSAHDDKIFCELYEIICDININKLVLQKEEVDDAKWATIDTINKLVKINNFKKSHGYMFKDYLNYINEKSNR